MASIRVASRGGVAALDRQVPRLLLREQPAPKHFGRHSGSRRAVSVVTPREHGSRR